MITLQDAANRLGCSLATIRRRLKAGQLDGAALIAGAHGSQWMVPVATIESLLAGARTTSAPARPGAHQLDRIAELQAQLDAERTQRLKAETEALVLAQQLDALHTTMRTLALTTGAAGAAQKRARWWHRKPAAPQQ